MFFAYSISHDIKNPAIGLYTLTKDLHKSFSDILGEEGKTYCEKIMKVS
jgi:light-regulated signal transduction histidine kinase (bacteriophytochrome)